MMRLANLSHAYGPATDLPPLCERIQAGDRAAVEAIANRIAHQGWVSTAVAAALVPQLWGLVEAVSGPIRADLILLLANLACAGDHQHFIGTGIRGGAPAAGLLTEASYMTVRYAVESGIPASWNLLDDPTPQVRSAAAVLLAATTTEGAEAVIEARLGSEKVPHVRADLLVALGWLADPTMSVLDSALAGRKKAERTGAAIALAMHRSLDTSVADILLRAATIRGSAWLAGDAPRHALAVFVRACERDGRDDLLSSAFATASDDARSDIADALMKTRFATEIAAAPDKRPKRPPSLRSLSESQVELLELLVAHDCGWWSGCDTRVWLGRLGLPTDPVAMGQYLGHSAAPKTILERTVGRRTYADWIGPRCTKRPGGLAAFAAEVASTLSVDDAMALAEQFVHVDVKWGWTRIPFLVHLLLAMGQGIEVPARRRIQQIIDEGVPSYWTAKGSRCSNPGLGYALLAACKGLDKRFVRPTGYPENSTYQRLCLKAVAEVDPPSARLLRLVLK